MDTEDNTAKSSDATKKEEIDSSPQTVTYLVPNIFEPHQFYEFIQKEKSCISKELLKDGYAPAEVIEKEYQAALDFLKYVEEVEPSNELDADLVVTEDPIFIGYNLFQVILDIYFSFMTSHTNHGFRCTLLQSLKGVFLHLGKKLEHTVPVNFLLNYCEVIVTENADLHSVIDVITESWKNLRKPWGIRKVLVQENIKDKFLSMLEKSLPKIDPVYLASNTIVQAFNSTIKNLTDKGIKLIQARNNDVLKATIAFGVPMSHITTTSTPIIVLDSFRTSKEAIALANKEGKGDFVSLWSENISETFEYAKYLNASTVWVNCHGILHPRCPFVINDMKYNTKTACVKVFQKMMTLHKPQGQFPDIPNVEYQQAFFDNGYFFTVTSEKLKERPAVIMDAEVYAKQFKEEKPWVKDGASMFNYDYKTIVVRYGQTFAN